MPLGTAQLQRATAMMGRSWLHIFEINILQIGMLNNNYIHALQLFSLLTDERVYSGYTHNNTLASVLHKSHGCLWRQLGRGFKLDPSQTPWPGHCC